MLRITRKPCLCVIFIIRLALFFYPKSASTMFSDQTRPITMFSDQTRRIAVFSDQTWPASYFPTKLGRSQCFPTKLGRLPWFLNKVGRSLGFGPNIHVVKMNPFCTQICSLPNLQTKNPRNTRKPLLSDEYIFSDQTRLTGPKLQHSLRVALNRPTCPWASGKYFNTRTRLKIN